MDKTENLTCLSCNRKDFILASQLFTPEVEGKKIPVVTECFECINCKTPIMNTDQMNILLNRAKYKFNQTKRSTLPPEQ